jgi:hypothetical protein
MYQNSDTHKSALELLPVEVKQLIFSNLSDVESMKSMALSSSSLYHGFRGFEKLVVTNVLEKDLQFDVLPELAVILKSSRLRYRTKQEVRIFAAINLCFRWTRSMWKFSEL